MLNCDYGCFHGGESRVLRYAAKYTEPNARNGRNSVGYSKDPLVELAAANPSQESSDVPSPPLGLGRWVLRECVRANPLYVISAALLVSLHRRILLQWLGPAHSEKSDPKAPESGDSHNGIREWQDR